jgi:succinoglycan biosynthesis transport protein ExoP
MKEISQRASETKDLKYAYSAEGEKPHLRDHWNVLLKHRRWFATTFVIVCLMGVYINLTATALYTSSAILKIEPQNPTVTGVSEMFPSPANSVGPYDYYQTQFALLQSRDLADRVVQDLGLTSNEVFKNIRIISANPLERIGSWLFGFAGTLSSYVKPKKQQESEGTRLDVNPAMVSRYLRLLKVKPVKNTRLVEIYVTTPDPSLSHELANAHAATFIRKNLETRFSLTNEAREFLETKNNELKAKLERSEEALNRFRQQYGVVSMEKGENIVVDRLADINKDLTKAQGERIEAESLYKTVQNKNFQSLSQIVNNILVQNLKTNVNNLESERVRLSTIFKPDHPRIVEITQQINEARRALNLEIANIVRSIESNYAAARAKEDALQAAAKRQQQAALNLKEVGVQYAVMQEEVNVNRALYQGVLKRLSETAVSNDLAVANMRVVQKAEMATSSSMPNTLLNLALTAAVALFLGVGLVFFLEYLDATVSTPEVVGRVVALSTLGVVPDLGSINRQVLRQHRSRGDILSKRLPRTDLRSNSIVSKELMLTHDPLSILGESYRAIRTALLFSQPERSPKAILFTSPLPGEGKTITTLNLGIALAQDGHRVLIIDADLRKGCCHARLGMKNHKGLSNVLNGSLSLEEVVQPTSVSGLSLLSSGIYPPNPCDLLGSRKMRQILNHLRESFNFILMDSPPAIAVSDAAVLSTMCDGVVLVLHAQKTTTASARSVMERLDAVRAPILGVILNGIDLRDPSYAYYRHYCGSDYGSRTHEAKNGDEKIIEAVTNADLFETHLSLGELGPGTVPREFFDHMASKLSDAVGPMAPVIVKDQIALLGESQDVFPKSRLKELFEGVYQEILDDKLKNRFQRSMQEQLTNFSHADLSEKESWPGELGPGTVPPEFFDRMTSKFTEVVGPMAPLILNDQVALLGESLESFPKSRLKELFERIREEILDQKLKRDFQQTMSSEIRSL